LVKEVKDVT
jgi:hypothetical protein